MPFDCWIGRHILTYLTSRTLACTQNQQLGVSVLRDYHCTAQRMTWSITYESYLMIQMKIQITDWIYSSMPIQSIRANLNEPIVITLDYEESASSRTIHWVCKNIGNFKCSQHTWVQISKISVLFGIKNSTDIDYFKLQSKFYHRNIQIIISILLVVNHWSINGPSSPITYSKLNKGRYSFEKPRFRYMVTVMVELSYYV